MMKMMFLQKPIFSGVYLFGNLFEDFQTWTAKEQTNIHVCSSFARRHLLLEPPPRVKDK
jgi:hypothetical protein